MEHFFKLKDLESLSESLILNIKTSVVRIDGPIGAGKTTLISSMCKLMGVQEIPSSPTFSLVNNYHGNDGSIYHFDFYRLEHPNEALDFGLEEYLQSGCLCFMEWADRIKPHLPLEYDHFYLEIVDETTRKLYSKY